MYSLLIVEDEFLPRTALCTMIQKGYPEISIVWEAEDGDEALKIARDCRPDILLIDINIPGLTGLDLCRALAEEGLANHTIITTAYGRFGYVKAAMDLGCQGYLLKPIRDKELEQALRKCFADIENRRHTAYTVDGLESMRSYAQPYLMQEFTKKGIQSDLLEKGYGWQKDGCLTAFYLTWESETGQENMFKILAFWDRALKNCFHMIADTADGCIRILLQKKESGLNQPVQTALWLHASLAVSWMIREIGMPGRLRITNAFSEYRQLNEAFQKGTGLHLVSTVPGQKYLEAGQFLGKDSLPKGKRAMIRQRILQRFREGNLERAAAVLHRLGKECPQQMIQLLLEALWNFDPELNLEDIWKILPQMMPGIPGIYRWLQQIWDNNFYAQQKKNHIDAISTALEIIQMRYAEPISEAEIAEEVGLSQAYFSRLFKQRTGENFSAVLSNIRLECARKLIEENMMDLNEIAVKSGFISGRYLDTVFKQTYGVSIAQYRLQKGGKEC